jgi:Protein of unknown function (DUF1565)
MRRHLRRSLLALLALGLSACSDEEVTPPDSGGADGAADGAGTQTDGPGGQDGPGQGDGSTTQDGPLKPDAAPAACGAISTFADGKQPATILHVAVTGSDTTGTGSAAKPFATIGQAAKGAKAGTAVRVHAGTYSGGSGYVANLSGTASAPIWIGGAPGEARPIIDGGSQALHLTKVRYLVVHDLEVRKSSGNGINCDDGGDYGNPDTTRHVVFKKLYIHDIGGSGNQDCLKLSGLDDYYVLDSTFAKCGGGGSGSGVDHVGCHDGLIARNTFKDMSGNAVQCKGGSERIEIRWNLMQEPGERGVNIGGSTGFTFFRPPLSKTKPNAEARKISVFANVIIGGATPLAFVGCVDCLAAHNTIVDPQSWLLRILQETTTASGYTFLPASNSKVINNIFYFDNSDLSTYVNVGSNTQPSSFTFANNLWFAHDAPGKSKPSLPVAETAAVVGQDPAFGGAAAGDYSIKAASPAAGKGQALAQLKGDRAGACYKAPPSIGAYEVKP